MAPASDRPTAQRVWHPAALRAMAASDAELRRLAYIVVDEIVAPVVALAVSPWPTIDRQGRVRFQAAADGDLIVPEVELRDRLYRDWLRRKPRVGDVLASRLRPGVRDQLTAGRDVVVGIDVDLADVFAHDVYDVSEEARIVAKAANHAAAARPISHTEARRRHQLRSIQRPRRSGRPGRVRAGAEHAAPHLAGDAEDPADVVASTAPPTWELPAALVEETSVGAFIDALVADPTTLVYFLLNVGDGDAQVVLLPGEVGATHRRAVVVDAASKTLDLLDALAGAGLLPDLEATPGVLPLCVATHPHEDHIAGLAELVARFGARGIGDFWEPGYYHPSASFVELMAALEDHAVARTQPTSGTTRWVDGVKVTALSPGVGLRGRYDSYGVEVNDASIALRLEFPAARVAEKLDDLRAGGQREYLRLDSPWSLILGADAQTTSWAQVAVDFPELHRQGDTPLYRELSAARGKDYLSAQLFKVSHHASKHGVNLELVERIDPNVTLVSSVGGGGRYNFPHVVAVEAIREGLEATTTSGRTHSPDHELGIHYTAATVDRGQGGEPLGSMAVVFPPARGGRMQMWRFGDGPGDPVDLDSPVRLTRAYGPAP